jgi:replicative DNA helicase
MLEVAKVAPHNIEAEQALLGAILIYNESLDRVSGFLRPNHFFEPLHGKLFEVMAKLIGAGKHASPITLKTFFDSEPPIGTLTVAQYLGRLAAAATTIINAQAYGRTIYDLAVRRELIVIGEDMVNLAYDSPVDAAPEHQIEIAESRLYDLADKGKYGSGLMSFSDATAANIWQDIKRRHREAPGQITGMPTGFSKLDDLIDGLRPETLTLIGARPKQGKTALCTSLAHHMIDAGACVAFFSLEMPAAQMLSRLIALRADVDHQLMMRGVYTEEEGERIEEAAADVAEWQRGQRLILDDTIDLTPSALLHRSRQAVRKNGAEVIFVDYIQRLASEQNGSRYEQVTQISMALANMRKAVKAPIVCAAQLNRKIVDRAVMTFAKIKDRIAEATRPNDGDLRESGQLEQDADAVIFLNRPIAVLEKLKPEDRDERLEWEEECLRWRRKAELAVHFNRAGPSGFVDLSFRGASMRFDEVARS